MKALITTNGHLYKNQQGEYFTPIVYGYDFFRRYIDFFGEIRLVAHVGSIGQGEEKNMLKVDGPNLEVFEVVEPRGKWQYIKNYIKIKRQIKNVHNGCDVAILRIPDQLSFQVFDAIYKRIPIGVEVTTNSWRFFKNKGGFLRPFLRLLWDLKEKRVCKLADATSYVTKFGLQKRYPPSEHSFTTNYTSADISCYSDISFRDYGTTPLRKISILHVSGGISGKEKGHKELIEATRILKGRGYVVNCKLVGEGELDDDIIQTVNNYNLTVTKLGRLSKEDVKRQFLESDLFVFPSYNEGLPRVVVEAMASGIMCIATRIDGIVELLPDSVLVPVRDSISLANKIEYYLSHPSEMTKNSKLNKFHSEEYAMDKLLENRIRFYSYLTSIK